ncbi:hypothetical protein [Streptomyces alkaliterrae]|uniref:Uncharacterized protein n=1 Tax=Streptomyces alkaliterrae TaxID=2213162 RepID=A0A5P0YTP5_9ACTN|nr:hypothetical protein [Streptomyces alkaliterrae]MBB1261597.1 hypothetical protein [Streptomyces alkaliterrae]MQS03681.1 hypothetical protein [Streptomyces alkaliterrae]
MSAQPDHAPVTPYAPAPGAPAELLAQLRADKRATTWVPAFEREWAAALEGEDIRHASVGQLSFTYWVNRPLRRLSVLTITWLG